MDTLKAHVRTEDEKASLVIQAEDEITIPLSEDNPAHVKSAFNRLILRVQKGKFKIKLENVGEDLFSQVASEYVSQLNKEIREVHGEMVQNGLISE